jgi:hypothetical protein
VRAHALDQGFGDYSRFSKLRCAQPRLFDPLASDGLLVGAIRVAELGAIGGGVRPRHDQPSWP